jgi:hypothetical protein
MIVDVAMHNLRPRNDDCINCRSLMCLTRFKLRPFVMQVVNMMRFEAPLPRFHAMMLVAACMPLVGSWIGVVNTFGRGAMAPLIPFI